MSESKYKLGSLFDGISGFPAVAKLYNIEPVWASEVEPACIRIANRHFPDMKQLGDITRIKGDEIEPVDIITGGSPCFPAGTMVLTPNGYIPIEDIKVGDYVLTHKGRWRAVTAIGNREAETYYLKGNNTIETTANHPIYSADIDKGWEYRPGERCYKEKLNNIGQWTSAINMEGKQWATPITAEKLSIPSADVTNGHQKPMPEMDTDFWYFIGHWLFCGWVKKRYKKDKFNNDRYSETCLYASNDEKDKLIDIVSKVCSVYNIIKCPTGFKIRFSHTLLCEWLVKNFGNTATTKTLPGWIFSMSYEHRMALLSGIIDFDGYKKSNTSIRVSSASKRLMLGIRTLAESLGYTTSVSYCKRPETYVILGRTVNQHDVYTVVINNNKDIKTGLEYDGHRWYECKNVIKTGETKTVYNISVEEDESYIADSIVVHNCQDLSVAGNQKGIKLKCDECGTVIDIPEEKTTIVCPECGAEVSLTRSGLFMEQIRIIKEMRRATNDCYPKFGVWENVCFTAGTLITCENGYKSIEDISVGDKVKTLSGNYFPVVKTHKIRRQPVILLKISGGEDLTVTENHPFYARLKHYTNSNSHKGRIIDPPKWTKAIELTENHLVGYRLDIPALPDNFITEDEAWAIGRWLADGSVDLKRSNPRIFISVGNDKINDTREHLSKLPYSIYENRPHATAVNFTFTSREFYSLISDANSGAGYKRVPNYVFSLPHKLQKIVLDGYISGDGYIRSSGNGIEISAATASRELAYGIARLIRNSYHVSANIARKESKNSCIDGREIKANFPSYYITASLTNKCSQSIFDDDIVWQPVKAIEKLEEHEDVYNISVLEDNTYEANGVISHNCGAFSSNNGDDFQRVLEEFCGLMEEKLPPLRPERWTHAGEILGKSSSIAWRTLDAQYWGVPQRRRRIFLVIDFGGQRAGEILFKQESLRRYPTPSRAPWKRITTKAENCSGTTNSSSREEPICVATQQVNAEIMANKYPTLTEANDTSGSNKPYVVLPNKQSEPIAFEPGAASRLGGHVWEDGKTGTLRADMGDNQTSVVIENPTIQDLDLLCNQSDNIISEPVYCLQGNGIDRADTAGCNGKGWKENVCYTLNTVDRPAVVYGISENMNGDVWTTEDRVNTLTTGGGKPGQGYPCVMVDKNDTNVKPYVAAFNHQQGACMPSLPYCEDLSPTLTSSQTMAVLIADENHNTEDKNITLLENHPADSRVSISEDGVVQTLSARMGTGGGNVPMLIEEVTDNVQSEDNNDYTMTTGCYMQICENQASTLMSRDYKDPQVVVRPKSIVRRLTPLECERLQGFEDNWTAGESDSERYKALGNSVALPCVDYVIGGIAEVLYNKMNNTFS